MPNFTEIIKQEQIKRQNFNKKILSIYRYNTPEYFAAMSQKIQKIENIKQVIDLLDIRLEEHRAFNDLIKDRLVELLEEIEGGAL